LTKLLDQLRDFHGGLDPARRRVLYVALAAALLVLVVVGTWASQPRYVTLTRASEGAARAPTRGPHATAGIPARVAADGITIEVLAEREIDARRAAAGDGGIVGLDGLQQLNPWLTPVQEQLHKQRMLQGELVRAINGIDGIAKCSVHLDVPSASEFLLRDDRRASAAVTLRPDEGRTLDPSVGKAVAELVAHSVTGMAAGDVSVLDQSTGRVLFQGGVLDPSSGESQLRAEQRRAAELQGAVVSSLARLLGSPDAVSASISVELDHAVVQSTVDAVDPDSASPVQERTESEGSTTPQAAVAAPGTDSNLPERSGGATPVSANRNRESMQTAYLYTRTQTTTTRPAGEVKRLSAAVFIDTAALSRVVAAAEGKVDEGSLRGEIEKAVRAAVGADERRGDTVVVTFTPFAVLELQDQEAVTAALPWERAVPYAAVLVAIAMAFLLVVRPLVAAVSASVRAADERRAEARAAEVAAVAAAEADDRGKVVDLAERLKRHVEGYQRISSAELSVLVAQENKHSAEVLRRWMRG
jgi:flagellar M-ring protein FliF